MRGKSLLNEKTIIILSLNQSECRKLLRSASSRIGFSRDTGIEERVCKSSCRPLFLAIRRRQECIIFDVRKLRKTFGKFFRSYSELLSKFGDISFQEYLSKGISHPVFNGDLVYKLRMVKDTPNFFSSGSKIVKRLRRRQYDPVIIERTLGLVLGPSTALYEPFLKHCTLTNMAVETIWRALSKPPQKRQGPDLCLLWLLVGTPSAIIPELAFNRAEHSRPYSDVAKYFLIYTIY